MVLHRYYGQFLNRIRTDFRFAAHRYMSYAGDAPHKKW